MSTRQCGTELERAVSCPLRATWPRYGAVLVDGASHILPRVSHALCRSEQQRNMSRQAGLLHAPLRLLSPGLRQASEVRHDSLSLASLRPSARSSRCGGAHAQCPPTLPSRVIAAGSGRWPRGVIRSIQHAAPAIAGPAGPADPAEHMEASAEHAVRGGCAFRSRRPGIVTGTLGRRSKACGLVTFRRGSAAAARVASGTARPAARRGGARRTDVQSPYLPSRWHCLQLVPRICITFASPRRLELLEHYFGTS